MLGVLAAETARCVDCYAVLFADEMNRCPAGHWTCPGCACDCAVLASERAHIPGWEQQTGLEQVGS